MSLLIMWLHAILTLLINKSR